MTMAKDWDTVYFKKAGVSSINIFVPGYYKEFKCIADKCTHSCCIGWEIDIDESSMEYYENLKGDAGKWVRENISKDETPHFILGEGERCPFLKENGLCEMILRLGENSLCNICADHPRFRNFYSDFTEMGIGMCCEEAARVILNFKEPFKMVPFEGGTFEIDEDEEFYLNLRQRIFDILCAEDTPAYEKFEEISKMIDFKFSDFSLEKLCNVYISMERLDEKWGQILGRLKSYEFDLNIFKKNEFQKPFQQLACYFIFRHFPIAMWDGEVAARIKFMLAGVYIIGAILSMQKASTTEEMAEIARMYSAEVEYSEENTDMLLNFLKE